MVWRIGEILIQKKLISWEQLENALEEQRKTQKLTGEILVEKGFISASLLYKTLAEQNGLKYVDLPRTRINPRAIQLLPKSFCLQYALIPIETYRDVIVIGISNPGGSWPENEILETSGMATLEKVICLPEHIQEALQENYGQTAGSNPALKA